MLWKFAISEESFRKKKLTGSSTFYKVWVPDWGNWRPEKQKDGEEEESRKPNDTLLSEDSMDPKSTDCRHILRHYIPSFESLWMTKKSKLSVVICVKGFWNFLIIEDLIWMSQKEEISLPLDYLEGILNMYWLYSDVSCFLLLSILGRVYPQNRCFFFQSNHLWKFRMLDVLHVFWLH